MTKSVLRNSFEILQINTLKNFHPVKKKIHYIVHFRNAKGVIIFPFLLFIVWWIAFIICRSITLINIRKTHFCLNNKEENERKTLYQNVGRVYFVAKENTKRKRYLFRIAEKQTKKIKHMSSYVSFNIFVTFPSLTKPMTKWYIFRNSWLEWRKKWNNGMTRPSFLHFLMGVLRAKSKA